MSDLAKASLKQEARIKEKNELVLRRIREIQQAEEKGEISKEEAKRAIRETRLEFQKQAGEASRK